MIGLSSLVLASLIASVDASASGAPAACELSAEERAWTETAIRASDHVMLTRLQLPRVPYPTIIVFNERCRFESPQGDVARWSGQPHEGKIRLLSGNPIDVGVWAMQDQDKETGRQFFVMSLPSIWIASKLASPGDPGLVAVFLHEFSHARQGDVLKPLFDAAHARYTVPEYFNDDSLQKRFEKDPAYVAVFAKEASLLYQAAAEPDGAKARKLAAQALALMESRQKRWFTGDDEMWKPFDDLYLTMEGFGQWNAYAWLSDPDGGGMTTEAARERMRGGRRWWSQEEGLALYLVIDRFVPDWARQSFASPPKLGIDLLREVAEGSEPAGEMPPET